MDERIQRVVWHGSIPARVRLAASETLVTSSSPVVRAASTAHLAAQQLDILYVCGARKAVDLSSDDGIAMFVLAATPRRGSQTFH
jgi:hypothetical protein